jgi:predicted aldo/keto reductase-like oxidoreductase
MENLTFEWIEKNMPKLGYGCMRLPLTNPADAKTIDFPRSERLIDAYMDAGFNYFDTAYVYHDQKSEDAVKRLIVERYPRESFFIADKLPVWLADSHESLNRIAADMFRRLGTDYIDFFLIHSLDHPNEAAALKHDAYGVARRLKAEGKARFIGASFHDKPEYLEHLLAAHPELEFIQLQINYKDWFTSLRADEYHRIAVKFGKPIIIMEPVRGGALADPNSETAAELTALRPDKSFASWAIRFCASLPGVATILSGMSTLEQVLDNIATIKENLPVTPDEMAALERAAHTYDRTHYISCTHCRYCEVCPQGIDIPLTFDIINEWRQTNNWAVASTQYQNMPASARADRCVSCEACEAVCPQHIKIVKNLAAAAKNWNRV